MKKTSLFGLVGLSFVVLVVALIAQSSGLLPNFNEGGLAGNVSSMDSFGFGMLGAYDKVNLTDVQFDDWELEHMLAIKNRLIINNTDPLYEGNREYYFYSLRNMSSFWQYQKSMQWLGFWLGQGVNGEFHVLLDIYNVPNDFDYYIVEISRFSWYSMDVIYNNETIASFASITEEGVYNGANYVCFKTHWETGEIVPP